MPSSTRNLTHKFLLDENVKRELLQFLSTNAFDVKTVSKAITDRDVANISKNQKRILVTNDEDFAYYTKDKVFSVIWLRIAQNNSIALLASFQRLLAKEKQFRGKLVVLKEKGWDIFPLGEELVIEGTRIISYGGKSKFTG